MTARRQPLLLRYALHGARQAGSTGRRWISFGRSSGSAFNAAQQQATRGTRGSSEACAGDMAGEAMVRIRKGAQTDLAAIVAVVNDAAQAYRGVIPVDRWRDPYMSADELESEISDGVVFWVAEEEGRLLGVMGFQDKGDVALVRHAYVAPGLQRKGVGTSLLRHVEGLADKPILIGTWASASWAIEFYRRNRYTVVPDSDKERLLRTYWSIPARQIETSVVLADGRWLEREASFSGRRSLGPGPSVPSRTRA
ncbi:MAG TPA: GNAT family N-acetyltransferase [Vicinamibacteria bacterium]|nr:GNAT family N-acetyltransferase [Vicinamibacteria bacterium]